MDFKIMYTVHIPIEWHGSFPDSFNDFMNHFYNDLRVHGEEYGQLNGFIYARNNVTAIMHVSDVQKIWWMKRVKIEDDDRQDTDGYYPALPAANSDDNYEQIQEHENQLQVVNNEEDENVMPLQNEYENGYVVLNDVNLHMVVSDDENDHEQEELRAFRIEHFLLNQQVEPILEEPNVVDVAVHGYLGEYENGYVVQNDVNLHMVVSDDENDHEQEELRAFRIEHLLLNQQVEPILEEPNVVDVTVHGYLGEAERNEVEERYIVEQYAEAYDILDGDSDSGIE